MKHFTKEEQKKYTESIRKVFNLPEEYLRRTDEKLPSDSKELKKDYLKLRSENTLLGERCNQLLTDKGKLTDRVQELEAQIEQMKCCKNCTNYMVSGKCPSFFRTGWCKNWEMAKRVSDD